MSESVYLEITGLSKYSGQKTPLLKDVNLKVKRGEWFSIIGPSNSGKSLLLSIIGGLQKPSSGSIKIESQDIAQLNQAKLTRFRKQTIGYIPQKYELLPYLTVMENVYLPMVFAGYPQETRIRRATELLKEVGMGDCTNSFPREISEGEKQRVAIARALVNNPSMIVADEPTSNLDLETGLSIIRFLKDLKIQQYTLICATHDLRIIRLSDKVVKLEKGEITKITEKHEILFKL